MFALKLYHKLIPVEVKRKLPESPRLLLLWIFSRVMSRFYFNDFKTVKCYCLFIGYPRTGHTLLNAMLNCHSNIMLSNELKDIMYVKKGFNKAQLFYLIIRNARLFHLVKKSEHTGYSYEISNSWQGKWDKLEIIGNKDAQYVTRMLQNDSLSVEKLENAVHLPLKFVHVTRHPLDTIATMSLKSVLINPKHVTPTTEVIDKAIEMYISYVETVTAFLKTGKYPVFHLRHEDFVESPTEIFGDLLDFLEVNHNGTFVRETCKIVNSEARQSRGKITWSQPQIDRIASFSRSIKFLENYFVK